MRASLDGDIQIVKTLLRNGVDVNARNHEGRTALMFAIINFHSTTVDVLLRFGADVNAQADDGCTPLILAAFNGDAEVAEALLARGADVAATLEPGKTALTIAVQHGHKPCIELLKRAMAQSLDIKSANIPAGGGNAKRALTI
jgi:ankyrin repeat protein